MSSDLWNFFTEVPSEGYIVESSYCTDSGCSNYIGNIDLSNIREFNLVSPDRKITKKFEANIIDFFEPRVHLSMDDSGKKINLDIAPENCSATKDGFLCIDKNEQDYKLKILIKKS
ncbi:hypothetical protein EJB10_02255 [Wolbachia endosymbiont of Brugia malayi]|uniref:hypothetical protein n=1 Tax=unclassified Wolbachia TaxID=2640676 RepID=UPI00004C9240|nr:MULTISPECIES: hypothetical protein [unclassified Wolbachia]AAW70639.1 Predicted protein [Wolbachia endosymbiont strain TRS of Brugia malayi]QCB61626.1 hypothetical protein EJB10_02255 [Wolbachia endosymbiont of Brugia malayi]QIT36687.1 hypothetical protein WBP_0054 [Wolbachia endosymbiont of Brugia pahangi]